MKSDSPDHDRARARPHEDIGRREAARGDERRTHRETEDGHPRAPPAADPGADHGREEVKQRRRDNEGHEADDVEPGVRRTAAAPRRRHRLPAGQKHATEQDPEAELPKRDEVRPRDEPAPRSQRAPQGQGGRSGDAGDPGKERDGAHDRHPVCECRDADGHDGGPDGHGRHRRPPQARVGRRGCGEGGGEERHDRGDGRRRGPGQREMERQPQPAGRARRERQRRRRGGEERGRDQDAGDDDPALGGPVDRPAAPQPDHPGADSGGGWRSQTTKAITKRRMRVTPYVVHHTHTAPITATWR